MAMPHNQAPSPPPANGWEAAGLEADAPPPAIAPAAVLSELSALGASHAASVHGHAIHHRLQSLTLLDCPGMGTPRLCAALEPLRKSRGERLASERRLKPPRPLVGAGEEGCAALFRAPVPEEAAPAPVCSDRTVP